MSFRLLARTLQRPPCIFKNTQAYSTLFSPPKPRRIDFNAFEKVKTTLLYVLRSGTSRELGLGDRDDGYVSVNRLLNHPEFQSLDMGHLQKIISTDRKHRFDLEFNPRKGGDSYWIRAKRWDETHWVMKPVLSKDRPGVPVYSTTLEQWRSHIARIGISRGESDWIQVSLDIPTDEYLLDTEDTQQVFIFLNLTKCMEAGLRFFSPNPSTQKWSNKTTLVTKGNRAGYIPPSMFSQVDFVTAKAKVLWGDSKPITRNCWIGPDEFELTPDGQRKTFLRATKGITGFVFPGARLGDVPGLKNEAMRILQS